MYGAWRIRISWRDEGGAGVVLLLLMGGVLGGGGILFGPPATAGERRHWSDRWLLSKEVLGQECSRSRDDSAMIVD